ncbi:MAG: DUF2147 domain-containing protein [Oligoflexus sp.]|nr:DUF2147 domain-containing protein [Pseudopedobacter sp.]
MKKLFLMMAMLFATSIVFAQSADAVVGKWINGDNNAHIQIFKSGNSYDGKLIYLKDPKDENGKAKVDANNPNSNLKTRPILGLQLLNNFNYDDGTWEDGTIYDPKTGKTYSCKITMNGKDKLNVRGYVGISLIGRTDVWTKVK